MSPRRPIKVLAVDDSAVVRQMMLQLLSQSDGFATETAADPLIARQKMAKRRPDVVILDLEMPRMDGMTFLRQLMREDPVPVIVCSGRTGEGTEPALQALAEGAVSVITKPVAGVKEFLEESAIQIADEVRAAAAIRPRRAGSRSAAEPAPVPGAAPSPLPRPVPRVPAPAARPGGRPALVAIGASTGGTEAIRAILTAMPVDCPPILVTQHMPAGFTAAFAAHLNQDCAIEVKEASDGDPVLRGRALIAPGNLHMRLARAGNTYVVRLEGGPLVSRHRPSVDVLLRSVAQCGATGALGVLLTGMGRDGVDGLLEMRAAGMATVAQDEATSVVFGMPKEAIAAGAAAEVLGLPRIPARILA